MLTGGGGVGLRVGKKKWAGGEGEREGVKKEAVQRRDRTAGFESVLDTIRVSLCNQSRQEHGWGTE